MSDDTPKPEAPDPSAAIRDLETKFIDKTARLEATVNSLTQKFTESLNGVNQVITSLAAQKLQGESNNGSDDDTFYTSSGNSEDWYETFKAAPTKTVKKLIEPELNGLETKITQKVKDTLVLDKEVKKYDDMAYRTYPQLSDPNHKLRQETEKVLKEYGNDFANRPSSIYDAARIAYANLVSSGELVPDSFKEEARRLLSIHDGEVYPFKSNSSKSPDDVELTPSQQMFAKKLGVSAEKYKQRLKNISLNK